MNARKKLNHKRIRRTARTAARMHGTADRPRLVVNRTNRYIYAQVINDDKGHTLAAVSSIGLAAKGAAKMTKTAQAMAAGEALAKKASAAGVKAVVLDRRASKFHGRIKGFADGIKKGGITI